MTKLMILMPLLALGACQHKVEDPQKGGVLPPCCAKPQAPAPKPEAAFWYEATPRPVTLKTALAAQRRLDEGGPGWHMRAPDPKTCAALKSVGVACDYNTRMTLSLFLTMNGHGLFPAAGGTNPYFDTEMLQAMRKNVPGFADDGFIGHGRQNGMLAAAVTKNAALFKDGDLKAEDVRRRWR